MAAGLPHVGEQYNDHSTNKQTKQTNNKQTNNQTNNQTNKQTTKQTMSKSLDSKSTLDEGRMQRRLNNLEVNKIAPPLPPYNGVAFSSAL